ncbi:GNAT family N-acetyltransferase [Vibrio sp. 10N.261.55.A7]|uniref:GNAT family N-acetyltransferase n=1 Tax=Vibrio sp. 10N.261.55.A7 TaxID=1880851 RepID=UPI000C83CD65|nr:GNAT family N-acetyltransferase [Vibrio sp. 10N.261.55.A7]PMJ92665.1 GNAT family N-acetyltransferase [Vibrio sp. 10N.261.55.A7]
MDHQIRTATLSDVNGINAVSIHLGYAALPSHEAIRNLRLIIESNADSLYVSHIGDVITGWLHLIYAKRLASPSFVEIVGLVVDPNYRRQGVAKALVERAIASHSGTVRVRCNEKRLDSRQFYQALGFNKTKTQHVFKLR